MEIRKMENKKTVLRIFGTLNYYLGADKDGINYFLQEATWDCNWYWGGGYVETYTNNNYPLLSKDIDSHEHFDAKFPTWDKFFNFFTTSPFTKEEKWTIYELMKSFYTARHYSDMLYRGGSYVTKNPARKTIVNAEEYDRINKEVIPAIMAELYKILGGEK